MTPRRPLDDTLILDTMRQLGGTTDFPQLLAALPPETAERTLQRRLGALVKTGRVERLGRTRSIRFRVTHLEAPPTAPATPTDTPPSKPVEAPHLSTTARELIHAIEQPLQTRRRVGYQRAFLDAYQPNVTAYLPVSLREKLATMGRVPNVAELAGTYARRILDRLLIDLSWNSSRLEGNTYSMLETDRLLAKGDAATGRNALETQMILNHKRAIEYLVDPEGEIGFDRRTLLNLHAMLSENLVSDPNQSGRLRLEPVGIGGTSYLPESVPQLVEEHFARIVKIGAAITDPFEQAFFAMVHLPYLQPFIDVNKRVSRLAANIPLVRANVCPLSFIGTPTDLYVKGLIAIYEQNRVELLRDVFEWSYDRSCARYAEQRQVLGEPDPFRLSHRQAIAETVAGVIRAKQDKAAAAAAVRAASSGVPAGDRARFIEVVETELLALHEGNFARFRVTPREFDAWLAGWN